MRLIKTRQTAVGAADEPSFIPAAVLSLALWSAGSQEGGDGAVLSVMLTEKMLLQVDVSRLT